MDLSKYIIYGPYLRKDGRKHIILYDPINRTRTTVSYPKYLLIANGIHSNYNPDETTDHIDEDFTNDDLNNLQVLTRAENARKSMERSDRKAQKAFYICPNCNKEFEQFVRQVKGNQEVKKRFGPFCSRSCAGKYNTTKQYAIEIDDIDY